MVLLPVACLLTACLLQSTPDDSEEQSRTLRTITAAAHRLVQQNNALGEEIEEQRAKLEEQRTELESVQCELVAERAKVEEEHANKRRLQKQLSQLERYAKPRRDASP